MILSKIKIPLLIFSIGIAVIGFGSALAEEIDSEFGEYASPGNVWIELTYSYEIRLPWTIGWSGNNPGEDYPKNLKGFSGELEIIKLFYKKYDIEILDVISSEKNAQLCEALGCIHGTYHLLISEEDNEKFQIIDLEQATTSGIYKLTKAPKHPSDLIFNLPYNITNANLENVRIDLINIIIEITTEDNGLLEIEIPKNLLYTQNNREPGEDYFIMIDGREVRGQQTGTTCSITYSIPFSNGSKEIELIGTYAGSDPRLPFKSPKECLQKSIEVLPPLKQFKSGIPIDDIGCKDGLELIFKATNNSPACVKPSTAQKLLERGWTELGHQVSEKGIGTGNNPRDLEVMDRGQG